MEKKKLPIGVQDFRVMREENSIYIDKTEAIHHILMNGNYYFLSRPRRFGKSLLLSIMKEIFKGSKELFEGLWIENNWDWTQKSPVVHLSFAATGYKEIGLKAAIENIVEDSAKEYGIELTTIGFARRFRELLEKLNAQYGKVVVLIDEYDKPIVDYITEPKEAKKNRDILAELYVVLKDTPQYLRFVFITGITKFAKVSVFSALNHLNDISLNENYTTLLGYTQEELEHYFKAYLPDAAKRNNYDEKELLAQLKHWYNGYSWDGENFVYNPFSILKFFSENDFRNHWFTTGTPTFLVALAKEKQFYDIEEIETEQNGFDTFDVEDLDFQAVMFQTGYLTIKKYDRAQRIYTLSYPNYEVRRAFLEYMIHSYANVRVNEVSPTFIKVRRALEKKDMALLIDLFNTMFANIPAVIFSGNSEKYFHSLVHLMLNFLGTNIQSEINTNKGRLDAVLTTPQYIYIFEFKFNKSADEAIKSIKSRSYAQKYAHSEKPIIALGINFSSQTKDINDWKEEILIN